MAENVKATDVVKLFQKAYDEKWGYIWGASGQIHTQAAQDQATRAQTKKYGAKWVGKRVADCSGLFTWVDRKSTIPEALCLTAAKSLLFCQ